jgi:hypothetical protein
MYVNFIETAAGLLAKEKGEKVIRYAILSMPKILLPENLFKNKKYGIYCTNASIEYASSLEKAEKKFEELKKSLREDRYEVTMVKVEFKKEK